MEREKPHTPYRRDTREGSNDLTSNEDSGNDPEIPAGWENGIDRSTSKERGE
jgi:hypothetical protein